MIRDAITIIIGGLRKDERTKTVKKIPLIGDIPDCFRSTSDEVKNRIGYSSNPLALCPGRVHTQTFLR